MDDTTNTTNLPPAPKTPQQAIRQMKATTASETREGVAEIVDRPSDYQDETDFQEKNMTLPKIIPIDQKNHGKTLYDFLLKLYKEQGKDEAKKILARMSEEDKIAIAQYKSDIKGFQEVTNEMIIEERDA